MRIIFIALALIGGLSMRNTVAQEPAASLKTITGTASVLRDNETKPLAAGTLLYPGDIVYTQENSSAGMTFKDGSRVGIGPDSQLQVEQYRFVPIKQDYTFDLYLHKGSAVFSSGKFGKLAPEAVRVKTPQAIIGIRGTKFLIKTD